MSHEYKIVEKQEDPLDTVFEKSNITLQTTLRDIISEETVTEKNIKELEGKYMIEKAKKENIEHFHPFVKELSDQDRATIHMYEEAHAFVRVLEPKIAELKQGLIDSAEERKEIERQTGLVGVVPAPVVMDKPVSKENDQKENQTNTQPEANA